MLAFSIESWIWYGVSSTVLLLRTGARILNFRSIIRLQLDDYLMLIVLCFYTTEVVSINIVSTATTNLLPPGYLDNHTLSAHDISERKYGSKMVLVVEQCQCTTVWLTKGCLLILYDRITRTSFPLQNRAIRILAVYVAVTFVVMEILYFGVWCQPFHNYWAVPTPNIQCSAAIHHLITNAVFNISSDLAMIIIAVPMFIRSHLPLQRKIALTGAFSLGIFVILCAILNKYYSFTQPFGSEWTYWYIRECSTAILVANLPFTWGLFRRLLGLNDDASHISGQNLSRSKSMARRASSAVRKPLKVITKGRYGNSTSAKDSDHRYISSSAPSRSSRHFQFANGDLEKGHRYAQDDDLILANAGGLDLSPCREDILKEAEEEREEAEDYSSANLQEKEDVSSDQKDSPASKSSGSTPPLPISDKAVLAPSREQGED